VQWDPSYQYNIAASYGTVTLAPKEFRMPNESTIALALTTAG